MTVEALWADICRNFAVWKGVGHFERKFQRERGVPTNDFWHQKSRVPGLSYGEKKLPKSSTAWVGCTNVTDDRQTDRRQTTDGRPIAYSKRNVIRWRLLKTTYTTFAKFFVYVTSRPNCGTVLFWPQYNVLCTSSFVNDAMFSHNWANGSKSKTTGRFCRIRQVAAAETKLLSVIAGFPFA